MKYFLIFIFIHFSNFLYTQYRSEPKNFEANRNGIKVEKTLPPFLSVNDVLFIDENKNNCIDANETSKIKFVIYNNGKGPARGVSAHIKNLSADFNGLIYKSNLSIGDITSNTFKEIEIPLNASLDLISGTANFEITFNESTGLPPEPIKINIPTKAFISPQIEVVDYSFLSDNGQILLGKPAQLKILIQNKGQGIGENIKIQCNYPSDIVANGEELVLIEKLDPGESKILLFDFIATRKYTSNMLSIPVDVKEKYGRFSNSKIASIGINEKSNGTIVNITSNIAAEKKIDIVEASLTADVDKNIPKINVIYPNRYALIVGNEDYTSRQNSLSSEVNVAFAVNDANIFSEYAQQTFGVDKKNIFLLINATTAEMNQKINLICEIIKRLNGEGEIIFYYAGHGMPDEISKTPFIIPVDVSGTNINNGLNLFELYKKFADANPKRATIFLDACFSGGGRDAGLLASRGVKLKPKVEKISGNIIILAASSADQSALPYKEKSHGMFTYQLLKKIQETQGKISYEELFKSIIERVSIESLRINQKAQDPTILYSETITDQWKTWNINE